MLFRSTNVADAPTDAPNSFELLGNHPNPFNPSTTIFFQLDKTADVSLAIYDVHGRLVRQLVSGQYAAGQHQVDWNGANDHGEMVAGGTYFLKLSSSSNSVARKMTLLK